MEDLLNFLGMGGYAAFVWPAFAIATAVMIALAVDSRRMLSAVERELAGLEESGAGAPDAVSQGTGDDT